MEEVPDNHDVRDLPESIDKNDPEEILISKKDPETISVEETISENEPHEDIISRPDFTLSEIPDFDGVPYVEVNGGKPYFTEEEIVAMPYESYSPLDPLGRCGTAMAMISPDMMPTEPRGVIGNVRPSGWDTVKYDVIPDRYLYNRCHLIAYQLTGQNDNELNLITGTRYLNIDGMLWWENKVADHIGMTGDNVLYRVTPYFEGEDLVARGVLMEAQSVRDGGICFCVFCYNVQPGIEINYADGSTCAMEPGQSATANGTDPEKESVVSDLPGATYEDNSMVGTVILEGTTYVLNTNTYKFHLPECDSVGDMKPKNTEFFDGTREEAVQMGYKPCGRCNP